MPDKYPEITQAINILKEWVKHFDPEAHKRAKDWHPAGQNWNEIKTLVARSKDYIENV